MRLETTHETDLQRDFKEAAGAPDPTEAVIHVPPEPDAAQEPDAPSEAGKVVDWVAEFNKHAKPNDDGRGVRP